MEIHPGEAILQRRIVGHCERSNSKDDLIDKN
jgi:hypothetical protein